MTLRLLSLRPTHLALLPLLASAAYAEEIRLHFPLACVPGQTCFVQHYVDQDSGPGARDYTCGSRTYDKHNGTDFRIRTGAEAKEEPGTVLAVAAGRVLRGRSDMADGRERGSDAAAVKGQECGNGLVIAHDDGWESQYCHMARASLRVRPGDTVSAGQPIGQVGLSGETEFPHLHLTLRHGGKVIDPFAPDATEGTCDPGALAPARRTLWSPEAQALLAYRAGTILNAGFADGPVAMQAVESGAVHAPGPDAAALVAYVRVIGLDAGDVQSLTLAGPDGRTLAERVEPALERSRAQSLLFAGRKRPPEGWPPGRYTARFTLRRGAAVALERDWTIEPAQARP
ncbi:M23 family metallopeptidase [Methylobacterium trifolii]|uniref:M23ase beta-sheet core domain-containing protein n=1 Tax=Methylobacterium trifolii TaxID=1003092 RepID=A0ABQ4U291_9HYPH|nr:M23 family metallopeptidase [Methylobacterium trifolii]GJE61585.1 hypothetical protein MPOCJGCO_3707 [Methylobacterium trifolii]